MSGKKLVMLVVVLAVACFAGVFGLTYMLGGGGAQVPPGSRDVPAGPTGTETLARVERLGPTAAMLDKLIRDIRVRGDAIEADENALKDEKRRIEIARDELKAEAGKLDALRVELAAPLARLKEMKESLERTRVRIEYEELENLRKAAKIYEKMDSEEGCSILVSMCSTDRIADAAKILYLMSEKGAARVMGAFTDKALAARLSEQMKRIQIPQQEG